jgi:hypothetical protein
MKYLIAPFVIIMLPFALIKVGFDAAVAFVEHHLLSSKL